MSDITPILMPKWGLSMKEGTLAAWHVDEGQTISRGQEIMDVETEKIANAVEAADGGKLRRRVGRVGETYRVKSLLGVMAADDVSDADIESYIAAFEAPPDEEEEDGEGGDLSVETSSGRIAYSVGGAGGQAVVLIHGFGGDRRNWQGIVDALSEVGVVHALDLPGHGASDKALAQADADGLADAVERFMDAVGIENAHLVGHSMGGLIAAMIGLRRPERVLSLSLIDPAGLGAEIDGDYLDGFIGATSRRELKGVLTKLFADPASVSRAMVDDMLKYKRLDGVAATLQALSASLFGGGRQRLSIADRLAAAATPILLIWGRDDAVIPAAHAAALPDAATTILPGIGHMPHIEAAAQVGELIGDFLRS